MNSNFIVFWRNNERAYALFQDLLARSERREYDDDFLVQLAAYRQESPDSERADIFAARYLLHHGDAESAAAVGERAFRLRPVSYAVWDVLSRAYTALGRYADALVMQGYASNLHNIPLALDIPQDVLTEETLARLSVAMGKPTYTPILSRHMTYSETEGLRAAPSVFTSTFLPTEPSYYVGAYTEQSDHTGHPWLLTAMQGSSDYALHAAGNFTYELIRGQRVPGKLTVKVDAAHPTVLPILGVGARDLLRVQAGSTDDVTWLSPETPNFFRLEEDATFSAEQDLIIGTPIVLHHHPSRHRLVLNILTDALPWTILRERFAEEMPRTSRFFARGIIFDQHFSTSEYTYPSMSAIETGMYPQHNQVFNDKVTVRMCEDYVPVSEHMRDMGYTTINIMGDGSGVYSGVTRGYDRLVVSPNRLLAYEGVERLIRYLDGVGAADHFVFLHPIDVHPWTNDLFQVSATVQAQLPIAERLSGAEEKVPSPYLETRPLYRAAFWQSVRNLDRALGTLFDYLEAHYTEEEYLVNLYSDHGVPIFSVNHFIVDERMTGAAWMMRGAGVPKGIVIDELASAVDIYPTLGHLLGFPVGENVDGVLPKIFGGTGRDVTFSQSLYPGRPYCLSARSVTHTLRLETEEIVANDGRVDLARSKVTIYPRAHEGEEGCETDSEELRAFFYPRVREFVARIASNGEVFPLGAATGS